MFFYRLMRRLSWMLLKVFFRFKVVGRESIPTEGPLVAVANHESFLDPFIVGVTLIKRPPITFLAAPWIFTTPIAGGFTRRVGAIPAYGEGKEVTALRGSINALKRGGSVALFPQGGIDRDGIAGGAVFMAIKADAPILPMRIVGAKKALPRKRWYPSLFTRITVQVQPLIRVEDLRMPGAPTGHAVAKGAGLLAHVLGLAASDAEDPA